MIQTTIRNDRNEIEVLDHNDLRYWQGPYVYVPFPKAVYRVTQPGTVGDAECRVVQHQSEFESLGPAWKESPAEAQAYFEALEADMARAAAESNYADRNMSAKAKAERTAFERSTDEMVTDVTRKRL